jgi:cytoskeleton protein RodZ
MTETLGNYLVACREKKGLAVEEVAQITRINHRLIDAAEHDRFDELPGRVFIRGFLRSYAKVVEADGEEFLRRFESLGLVEEDRSPKLISMPLHEDSTRTSVMLLLAAVIVSILIVGVSLYGSQLSPDPLLSAESQIDTPEVAKQTPIEAVAIEPEAAPMSNDESLTIEGADADPEPAVEEAPKVIELGAELAQQPETKISAEPATTSSADFSYRLKIMAESDSWIKVVIDDDLEREIILRGGNSVTWMANTKYLISIGNVAGTRIFLNGKEKKLKQPSSNVLINILLPGADSDEMEKIE